MTSLSKYFSYNKWKLFLYHRFKKYRLFNNFYSKVENKLPSRSSILKTADEKTRTHSFAEGIAYAERYLPEKFQYTVNVLRANEALSRGSEKDWLLYLNRYLAEFNVCPIRLDGDDSIIERLSTENLPDVNNGPLISVIMPAWNAEDTIVAAVHSILNQTWRPLELIIVDDASTDHTWTILQDLASRDQRIRLLRNSLNVGPYISKNRALLSARGDYITGHDADDWAHPQRLERHLKLMMDADRPIYAGLMHMLRIKPSGEITTFSKLSPFSPDGIARVAAISCMFEKKFLTEKLGFWDSVRFGADSEMIARTEAIAGGQFGRFLDIGMICLDADGSLTNHNIHGIHADKGGLSVARRDYKESWMTWHAQYLNSGDAYLEFPLKQRRYEAVAEMIVPIEDIQTLLIRDK